MVFSKRIALGYDPSCTIWESGIVFPKTCHFFPGWKMRERWPFSRNTRKHDIFYLICSTSPLPKRSKMILSAIHLTVIDILDRYPRKSSSNSLYIHGGLYRRFDILLSSEKKQETSCIGLKFDFFFNLFGWRYSTMNNLQYFVPFSPHELCLGVCLSADKGLLFH